MIATESKISSRSLLGFLAALTGFVIMAFELVAVRCLSPFYGSSIVVWTSILGSIMTSLALGAALGGRLADRSPTREMLGRLLVLGGASILVVSLVHTPFLLWLERSAPRPLWGTLIGSATLFMLPAILLAAVYPFVIRLSLSDVTGSGALSGYMSALSSIGSIGGTFAAGFFIIPSIGTTSTFAVLAGATGISSLFLSRGVWRFFGIITTALSFSRALYPTPLSELVLDQDTMYSRAWVIDHREEESSRPIRSLFLDPYAWQGSVFKEDDRTDLLPIERAAEESSLVVPYTRAFRLAGHFVPEAKRILILGGGILSIPREFLKIFPNASIDVVELDSELTKIAESHFGFRPDPRIRFHHVDGRLFLNRTTDRYEVIIVDVFTSALSIPFHLATVEAVQRLHALCSPEGVVLTNLIGVPTGTDAHFVPREVTTYRAVFPYVESIPLGGGHEASRFQNVIVASSHRQLRWEGLPATLQFYGEQRREIRSISPESVFTDDFAPVEYVSTIGWRGKEDSGRKRPSVEW